MKTDDEKTFSKFFKEFQLPCNNHFEAKSNKN